MAMVQEEKGRGKAQQRTADVLPAAKGYKISSIAPSQGRQKVQSVGTIAAGSTSL